MRIFASFLALGALASPAFAADLPARAAPPVFEPPVVATTWTGCYAGIKGAADIAQSKYDPNDTRANRFIARNSTATTTVTPIFPFPGFPFPIGRRTTNTLTNRTFVTNASARDTAPYGSSKVGGDGAARFGCDRQFGRIVIGGQLEAGYLDGSGGATLDPRRRTTLSFIDGGFYGAVTGRLGYAVFDRTLLYVRGGVGYADLKYGVADPRFGFSNSVQGGQAMPLAGAGIEYKLTPQIGLTAEYTYMRPGCRTVAYTADLVNGGTTACINNKHTVSLGLNYYFNPVVPVVARY